jgi:hypothetical protein
MQTVAHMMVCGARVKCTARVCLHIPTGTSKYCLYNTVRTAQESKETEKF